MDIWYLLPVKYAVKSMGPSDAYMRQWIMPSLVQIMACRVLGSKPLSEPILSYFYINS